MTINDLFNYIEIASIVADGIKTYSQLFKELAILLGNNKDKTTLIVDYGSSKAVYQLNRITSNGVYYSSIEIGGDHLLYTITYVIDNRDGYSRYFLRMDASFNDGSNDVVTNGVKFIIVK